MFNKNLRLIRILLIAVVALIASPLVKAEDQFNTSYDITYEIDRSGVTTITQNIKIENKLEDILATTYSITVKQMEITNVTGKDKGGNLEIDIKRDQEKVLLC